MHVGPGACAGCDGPRCCPRRLLSPRAKRCRPPSRPRSIPCRVPPKESEELGQRSVSHIGSKQEYGTQGCDTEESRAALPTSHIEPSTFPSTTFLLWASSLAATSTNESGLRLASPRSSAVQPVAIEKPTTVHLFLLTPKLATDCHRKIISKCVFACPRSTNLALFVFLFVSAMFFFFFENFFGIQITNPCWC